MKIIMGTISNYKSDSDYTLTFDNYQEVQRIAAEYLKGRRNTNAGDIISLVGHPAGTLETQV